MNDFPTEFKNEAYRLRMTEAERSRIRARVTQPGVASPYLTVFSLLSYQRALASLTHRSGLAVAFSFVLVVGGAGGTLYAAEGTLPGDALYTIKTTVAEPLSGVFAVSEEAQTKWHAKLAVKRLTEAEELAKEGRLTDENSAALAASFTKHVEAIDDKNESVTTDERDTSAGEGTEDPEETFEAVIAAKGASILDATDVEERRGQRVASAHFVLSVLGGADADTPQNDTADVAMDARMTKSAMVEEDESVSLMALSAHGPLPEDANEEESLEDLKTRAKEAFQAAREKIEDSGSRDSYRELSLMLRVLVRAEAKSVTGDMDSARAGFEDVILRADTLAEESRTDNEGEVEGWMDSTDVRTLRDRDDDEEGRDRL